MAKMPHNSLFLWSQPQNLNTWFFPYCHKSVIFFFISKFLASLEATYGYYEKLLNCIVLMKGHNHGARVCK
uniref:Uncharacterized protein n=1 Tax=Oryza brachyantha TaxID=4533 RepID=J3N8A3_ORYBR